MSNDVRDMFDRNVRAKATIGGPFTLDDVAATIKVPVSELRSSWLTPFANADIIRAVGTAPSKNPKSRGRHITVWQGTYYLDLEAEEEREAMEREVERQLLDPPPSDPTQWMVAS